MELTNACMEILNIESAEPEIELSGLNSMLHRRWFTQHRLVVVGHAHGVLVHPPAELITARGGVLGGSLCPVEGAMEVFPQRGASGSVAGELWSRLSLGSQFMLDNADDGATFTVLSYSSNDPAVQYRLEPVGAWRHTPASEELGSNSNSKVGLLDPEGKLRQVWSEGSNALGD